MNERSDGQLLTTWSHGDVEAFEALVDRHQTALLRHAHSMLGDRGGVEDVVQETFLRLAQKPPVIPDSAKGNPESERAVLAAWLHKVTRNLCMDAIRGETRRRRREEEVAPVEASTGGLDAVEAGDTREAVERSLQRLPDDQREVLVLRLFGDRSYKEIAEVTGKKVGTIGWLISVGLKALAAELSPLVAIPIRDDSSAGAGMTGSRAQRLEGGLS